MGAQRTRSAYPVALVLSWFPTVGMLVMTFSFSEVDGSSGIEIGMMFAFPIAVVTAIVAGFITRHCIREMRKLRDKKPDPDKSIPGDPLAVFGIVALGFLALWALVTFGAREVGYGGSAVIGLLLLMWGTQVVAAIAGSVLLYKCRLAWPLTLALTLIAVGVGFVANQIVR